MTQGKVPQIDTAVLDGQYRSIGANTPLLLTDLNKVTFIQKGSVDVFAVRVKEGVPSGQRHPLYRAQAGDMLFGLEDKKADFQDNCFSLIAVGVSGTEVLENVSLDNFQKQPLAYQSATINRFMEGIFSQSLPKRLTEMTTRLEAGRKSDLYKGVAAFSGSRELVWGCCEEKDHLCLFGHERLSGHCLPLSNSLWLETDKPVLITTKQTQDVIKGDGLRSLLFGVMGLFQHYISQRIQDMEAASLVQHQKLQKSNREAIEHAVTNMAGVIRPDLQRAPEQLPDEDALHVAFLKVARYLKIPTAQTPRRLKTIQGHYGIDDLALLYGLRTRKVILTPGWTRQDVGPLLAYTETDHEPIAVLPTPKGGYEAYNPKTKEYLPCEEAIEETIYGEADMLYRPLPNGMHSLKGLIQFALPSIASDLRMLALMGMLGGLLALLTPILSGVLIESTFPRADMGQHIQIVLALVVAALGACSFEIVKAISLLRAESRVDLHLQAALFDRLLNLPVVFFKRYTAGDLTDRVLGIQTIRQVLTGSTVQGLLGMSFSVLSLLLLFYYNWKLALVAVALVISSLSVTAWLGMRQLSEERKRIAHQGVAEGFIVQLLSGITKLRIAGAETRAYARWAHDFTRQKKRFFKAQYFSNLQEIFQAVFPVLATGVIFIAATTFLENNVIQLQLEALVDPDVELDAGAMTTGDFVAFNAAFGQFMAAMTALVTSLTKSLKVIPLFERVHPLIEASSETEQEDTTSDELNGAIDVSHLSFRYEEGGSQVLNNINLSIRPNEFVALVGASGSGKSTLVRLMLGFEKPSTGEVLYDGTPLSTIDMSSLRRQLKVVTQNAHLTTGSILSNIVGRSSLTIDDAWHAAKLAGLDKDIEAMPMGMHTVLMEGVNTLSGGQRQRLMIARALVHRPRILLLDEPTSALDNTSQETVMNSLTNLNATRLVIAHRLSTIQHADRILVMDGGQIVQQGTYDQLVSVDGLFRDLTKRQLF
ncbi:NHLP bacteriocin export ABC transporter permease/ATPase subunit [Terasakiella pusilla]|uniref:NHLP bacteriocin export ABC transporter permease/ATPase subunit n=1 Tax=Terasakiella pusilla TaxID=64973 RepID=UPI003AA80EC5